MVSNEQAVNNLLFCLSNVIKMFAISRFVFIRISSSGIPRLLHSSWNAVWFFSLLRQYCGFVACEVVEFGFVFDCWGYGSGDYVCVVVVNLNYDVAVVGTENGFRFAVQF